jgi:urea transport system ATP-binding protein
MLTANNIDLFYGASQALADVSLEAKQGEITCILGRNGVGKSSLMQAITGRHPVNAGSIIWDDKDITKLAAADRARMGIAYVPNDGREGRKLLSRSAVYTASGELVAAAQATWIDVAGR